MVKPVHDSLHEKEEDILFFLCPFFRIIHGTDNMESLILKQERNIKQVNDMINMMEYKTERLTAINQQLEKCHNECNAILAQAEMKLKNGKNLTPLELDTVILAINEMSSKGEALLNGIMAYL